MRRASQRSYHYIYKITRISDGKYYIGMHSTDVMEDGYFGSGKIIARSIKKHGIAAHTKQIIELVNSREELSGRERELVNVELLNDPLCMNLSIGGLGGGGNGWAHAHSSSAAEKRLQTRTERNLNVGEKNNSWGTCWICHPLHGNKRIDKSTLNSHLADGWVNGRKMAEGFGKAQGDALRGKKLIEIVGEDNIAEVRKNRYDGRVNKR